MVLSLINVEERRRVRSYLKIVTPFHQSTTHSGPKRHIEIFAQTNRSQFDIWKKRAKRLFTGRYI
jgi:hypothetical protein